MSEFVIGPDEAGLTLAAVLRRHGEDLAWSRARALCAGGRVLVDGTPQVDPAARVAAGQRVSVAARSVAPPAPPVVIVYEDAHVVVIDKPAGVSSVPYEKRERGTAMDLVRAAWRAQGRRAVTAQPLIVVHRLDKDTSGLIAFAKSKLGEAGLAAQFRRHTAQRTYLCVAHGTVTARRIASQLVTDRGDGLRGSTRRPGQGRRAVTLVEPVEALRGATLCRVRLETGKTHQIRIHLAESGHPLVGERVYLRDFLRAGKTPLASPRLLLHAATLAFTHPLTGRLVELGAEPPPEFTETVAALRRPHRTR
jgi:23S rRNA pseudouridine1911/1915/1917 synthase